MLKSCAALVAAAGLVVTVACAQTDAGITTSVKTRMAAADTVKAYEVSVDTRNGVVTLSGEVATTAEKEQALRIARETEGVRDVIDQIRIGEAAPTAGLEEQAGQAGQAFSDAAITTTVKSKFLADNSVKGLRINVDTSAGVVTLSGNVSTRAEADRAIMLARETEGVIRVVDNMKVSRS